MSDQDDFFEDAPQRVRKMKASFDSPCPGCWDRIEEGETIYLYKGEWVCEDCADV